MVSPAVPYRRPLPVCFCFVFVFSNMHWEPLYNFAPCSAVIAVCACVLSYGDDTVALRKTAMCLCHLKAEIRILVQVLHVGTGVFKLRPLHVSSYTNTE